MLNSRLLSRLLSDGLLLILAGSLALPFELNAQVNPAPQQSGHGASPSPAVQIQLNKLEDAQKTAHAASDAKTEARTLSQIGDLYFGVPDFQKAMGFYNSALALARSANDQVEQTAALLGIARCYRFQAQRQKALETFQQLLEVATAAADASDQTAALVGMGNVNYDLGDKQKALRYYNQALLLERKTADRNEAFALIGMGNTNSDLGDKQKALEYFNQALPVLRKSGDRRNEAAVLLSVARCYRFQVPAQNQKASEAYQQSLDVATAAADKGAQVTALMGMGDVNFDLGDKQKALEYYNLALPIEREAGDRRNEAGTLQSAGWAYVDLGNRRRALEYFQQELPLARELGDRGREAAALAYIGTAYSSLGEKAKALEYYNQALPIQHEINAGVGESDTLIGIGSVYLDLGKKQLALDSYNQALALVRQAKSRLSEANMLMNVGLVYASMGENQKALDNYNLALPIFRQTNSGFAQLDLARLLNNMAGVYSNLGDLRKALEYYNQALPIFRQMNYPRGQANTLSNLGITYGALGDQQNALDSYSQALALATTVSDPLLEAYILVHLQWFQKASQPGLAIFYGKQAINLVQQVRGNIQGLDKDLQKSFLDTKVGNYHDLANLLIAQGRLPEAQQVLDLLKQQEYTDYVRGETANTLSPLSLTPAEKQAEADYQRSTAQLVSLSAQWAQLKKNTARTAEQEKQYQQLSDQLEAASKGLNDYYAHLYVLFDKKGDANKQVADVKGGVSALKQTIAKMPHTVALYTLVSSDRISIIVVTASATVAREFAIAESDLNKKVAAFEQVLRNPAQDPRPLAQELYTALIAPVKSDLDQAEAQTLVWSLDGVLRYVPIAALYDGKQYVLQNYDTVTITPASIAHLNDKPDVSTMSSVAMGISQKYEDGLPALPAVATELNHVVNDPKVQGSNGVLRGTILLNDQFTEKGMENLLGGQHTVVHIASHFVFKPGDDSQSYLLLSGKGEGGAGFHLTVADFRDNQQLALDDTDLLTLSACETGMSGSAGNGREVDGLGTTAQLKGAKAVISSLWSVNDASTGQLMGDFYRRWAEGAGNVTKVEALRQAQLDLLLGRVNQGSDPGARGSALVEVGNATPAIAGYAHPFYWAPFVLMGNWR